jgi:hypothetical protein
MGWHRLDGALAIHSLKARDETLGVVVDHTVAASELLVGVLLSGPPCLRPKPRLSWVDRPVDQAVQQDGCAVERILRQRLDQVMQLRFGHRNDCGTE